MEPLGPKDQVGGYAELWPAGKDTGVRGRVGERVANIPVERVPAVIGRALECSDAITIDHVIVMVSPVGEGEPLHVDVLIEAFQGPDFPPAAVFDSQFFVTFIDSMRHGGLFDAGGPGLTIVADRGGLFWLAHREDREAAEAVEWVTSH